MTLKKEKKSEEQNKEDRDELIRESLLFKNDVHLIGI